MQVMIDKGYAEAAPQEEDDKTWYIPHHGVVHPNKPNKVRVVFDCSADYAGGCVNKILLKGPDLTNQIVGVLCRFREEQIVVTADIEAMYYQVSIPPDQRSYFRFLWFENNDINGKIKAYQMTRHVFGGTSSPSCANYALRRTANDNKEHFDEFILNTIQRNFYVDDLLKSIPPTEDQRQFTNSIKELCSRGGFNLTKFVSNVDYALQDLDIKDKKPTKDEQDLLQNVAEETVLGLKWDPNEDLLSFRIKMDTKPLTRRGILSTINSIYDPLGLVGPLVLKGKQIMQRLSSKFIQEAEGKVLN